MKVISRCDLEKAVRVGVQSDTGVGGAVVTATVELPQGLADALALRQVTVPEMQGYVPDFEGALDRKSVPFAFKKLVVLRGDSGHEFIFSGINRVVFARVTKELPAVLVSALQRLAKRQACLLSILSGHEPVCVTDPEPAAEAATAS